MSRIGREQAFMDVAEVFARRATCFRGNSGAVVVFKKDIVSVGYNGPPSGDEHCKGSTCELTPAGGCRRSVHAEVNAIDRAVTKRGDIYLQGCMLYTLHSPCLPCANAILDTSISMIFYRHPYRLRDGLQALLADDTRHVYRVTQSGMIIDERTNELCTL